MIELAAVKKTLPRGIRTMLTQEFLDRVEASVSDTDIADGFKDNFMTYIGVLRGGKYKIEDYVNAVKYISHKLLGKSNADAYAATFPDRYARISEGHDALWVSKYVNAYNNNKLVNLIFEQTMVPSYVLNAPLHQEALNVLAETIRDPSTRPMVRVKACETILNYTKPPEVTKAEITIGIEQQDTIGELRDAADKLAELYKKQLDAGNMKLKEIAEAKVIDVTPVEEVVEVDDEFE